MRAPYFLPRVTFIDPLICCFIFPLESLFGPVTKGISERENVADALCDNTKEKLKKRLVRVGVISVYLLCQ